MSHPEHRAFIEIVSKHMGQYFKEAAVLEVGSLNINGSVRTFFHNCTYTGIDVLAGKDVDIVCQGEDYDAPDNSYDQVLSCEVMEHNPSWAATFKNMIRICKPGGLILITCATIGRPEHGTTRSSPQDSPLTVGLGWEYYQNLSSNDFLRHFDIGALFEKSHWWVNWTSYDLYFCGIKCGSLGGTDAQWDAMIRCVDGYVAGQNARKICIYRSIMAGCFGDWWFNIMRSIGRRMGSRAIAYIHG